MIRSANICYTIRQPMPPDISPLRHRFLEFQDLATVAAGDPSDSSTPRYRDIAALGIDITTQPRSSMGSGDPGGLSLPRHPSMSAQYCRSRRGSRSRRQAGDSEGGLRRPATYLTPAGDPGSPSAVAENVAEDPAGRQMARHGLLPPTSDAGGRWRSVGVRRRSDGGRTVGVRRWPNRGRQMWPHAELSHVTVPH